MLNVMAGAREYLRRRRHASKNAFADQPTLGLFRIDMRLDAPLGAGIARMLGNGLLVSSGVITVRATGRH